MDQLNDAIKVIKKQDDSNKQLDEKIDRRTHGVNAFAAHIADRTGILLVPRSGFRS